MKEITVGTQKYSAFDPEIGNIFRHRRPQKICKGEDISYFKIYVQFANTLKMHAMSKNRVDFCRCWNDSLYSTYQS